MDESRPEHESRPKIVGSRVLPCHGQRARRLVVSATPVTRSCPVCAARYSIAFVEEPAITARLGLEAYRLEISPWVDGRVRRRLDREATLAECAPTLPFDTVEVDGEP